MANSDYVISWQGLDELECILVEAADLAPVKELTKKHTGRMARTANSYAPHKTGFLKRSGIVNITDGGMEGSVTFYAEYSAYQEYGTRWIVGKFYLKRAFELESNAYLNSLERLFG